MMNTHFSSQKFLSYPQGLTFTAYKKILHQQNPVTHMMIHLQLCVFCQTSSSPVDGSAIVTRQMPAMWVEMVWGSLIAWEKHARRIIET